MSYDGIGSLRETRPHFRAAERRKDQMGTSRGRVTSACYEGPQEQAKSDVQQAQKGKRVTDGKGKEK